MTAYKGPKGKRVLRYTLTFLHSQLLRA